MTTMQLCITCNITQELSINMYILEAEFYYLASTQIYIYVQIRDSTSSQFDDFSITWQNRYFYSDLHRN